MPATKKPRALVIIDGSNFYKRRAELPVYLHKLDEFDYKSMAADIAKRFSLKVVRRNYYIGVVRAQADDAKGQKMRVKQQQLFSHLESKSQKFNVVRGELRQQHDKSYKEKGVDVRMAVDIIDGAHTDLYDYVLLFSSDTDLIPAIKLAMRKKKKLIYCGFAHKPTTALMVLCEDSVLFDQAMIEDFIV